MTTMTTDRMLRSRRDLLTGQASRSFQIASLLVQALPARMDAVARQIDLIPGAETHPTEAAGRLIVILEAETDSALVEAMSVMTEMSGVISTSLVYHQIEETDDA